MADIPRIIDLGVRKFSLGQVVATPSALRYLEEAGKSPLEFITRHARGDWGDCCDEDKHVNEQALKDESRLFSVFKVTENQKVWVITDADRSVTCILLPDDY